MEQILIELGCASFSCSSKWSSGQRQPWQRLLVGVGSRWSERTGAQELARKTRLAAGNQIHVVMRAGRHQRAQVTSTCGEQRRSTSAEGCRTRTRWGKGPGGSKTHQKDDGGLAEVGEEAKQPELSVAGDGRRRKMTTMALI
jgi:hypothetical protein